MIGGIEPGRRVDRFEVVGLLGEGGMAAVWEVVHVDLRTRHALKMLQIVAPGLTERLVGEGRMQAGLRHPNVCHVTDVVRMGEVVGLVMELVHGPSLDGLLASYQPNQMQADHLARGVIAGVSAAHAAGLVHRDLKPANVLVAVDGFGVVPKVADFGLAKAVDDAVYSSGNTRSGVTMGTPCYMAPEQFRDAKRADRRSDLFSVGCILYEIVSGMKPFDGPTPLDIYHRTSTGAYRPLSEVAPNVPGRMAAAVARALEPDPAERFADCAELLATWCGAVEDHALEGCWEASHLELLASLGRHGPVNRSTVSIGSVPPLRHPTVVPDTPSASAPPPVRRGHPPVTLLALAGTTTAAAMVSGSLGLLLLAGVIAAGGLRPVSAEPDEQRPVPEAPPPRPEPEPELEPEPEPEPEPRPEPETRPEPAAAPPPFEPPAAAPAPAMGALTVAGGLPARLSPDTGGPDRSPGEVPPGKYGLHVFFHPDRPTRVLDVTVMPGDRIVATCSSLKVCRCEPVTACR